MNKINKAKKLNQIKSNKDILSLSHAQFPGPHCPLFGAIMTASYIEDMPVLIIGTEECTYYGKDFAVLRQEKKDKVFSAVLEQKDITFGCEEDLKAIIKNIIKKENPKALLVVTTCVVELVGEDVESILHSLSYEINIPLLIVKTEHFKCTSHIEGVERTFNELYKLMKQTSSIKNTVNILGYKYLDVEKTELVENLISKDIKINMCLPSKSTISQIESAANCALNIVVENTALGLAKKMEETFNIPYVNFPSSLDICDISNAYNLIEKHLNIKFDNSLYKKSKKISNEINLLKKLCNNKSFVYGNTPFNVWDFALLTEKLGMYPTILQVRNIKNSDFHKINSLIDKNINPFIVQTANIAPLRDSYKENAPDYYFGHESPMLLSRYNIKHIVLDEAMKNLGYERILITLNAIKEEKGMFSLMGQSSKKEKTTLAKSKIKNIPNMPNEIRQMLLNMPVIPEKMADKILSTDENNFDINNLMGGAHHASI